MYLFRYMVTLDVADVAGTIDGRGITFAKDYGDAARKVEEYYKEELYSIDFLMPIADGEVIPLEEEDEDFVDSIQKNWVW